MKGKEMTVHIYPYIHIYIIIKCWNENRTHKRCEKNTERNVALSELKLYFLL